MVQNWTAQADLTLHPDKTRIVDAETDGFDFLGYHFRKRRRWPRRKSLAKLQGHDPGEDRGGPSGRSLERVIVIDVNPHAAGLV